MPPPAPGAGPAAVVRIWSGLGYNRRALNLHRAARIVVAEHAGVVPADESALRSLPGIGPYTARAVRSFAFGVDVAPVDTNALRVLSRCVAGAPLTVSQAQSHGRSPDPGRPIVGLQPDYVRPRGHRVHGDACLR